jgi:hypothetical protein
MNEEKTITFKKGQEVLCRDAENHAWRRYTFLRYTNFKKYPYETTSGALFKHCILWWMNEKLEDEKILTDKDKAELQELRKRRPQGHHDWHLTLPWKEPTPAESITLGIMFSRLATAFLQEKPISAAAMEAHVLPARLAEFIQRR